MSHLGFHKLVWQFDWANAGRQWGGNLPRTSYTNNLLQLGLYESLKCDGKYLKDGLLSLCGYGFYSRNLLLKARSGTAVTSVTTTSVAIVVVVRASHALSPLAPFPSGSIGILRTIQHGLWWTCQRSPPRKHMLVIGSWQWDLKVVVMGGAMARTRISLVSQNALLA